MHGHYKCPQPFSTLLERQYIFLFKAITTGVKKSNGEKTTSGGRMLHGKNTNFANLQAKCARAPGIFAGPLASPTLMFSHTHISCTSQGSDHNS